MDAHRQPQQPGQHPDLPLGAHLVTPRFGYLHHGIYAGEGRVVHYSGLSLSLRNGPVLEVSLAVFAGGRGFSAKNDTPARYAGTVAVARARSRLGENRYRVATNNCEHFCAWCLQGESRSEQIERIRRWPVAVAAALGRLARMLRPATSTPSRWTPSPAAF